MRSDNKAVWFLTSNGDKFSEARSILEPLGVRVRHLPIPKVEIQDPKLENIAKYALREALKVQKEPIVVEDSGLFIDSLHGFPGPYSSFVYGTIGLTGILRALNHRRDRRAYFQSTVAYGAPGASPRIFTGRVKGRISRSILGSSGFGFDPIFIPEGYEATFGETSQRFKNDRSHRGLAFRRFAGWFTRPNTRTVKNRTGKRALK